MRQTRDKLKVAFKGLYNGREKPRYNRLTRLGVEGRNPQKGEISMNQCYGAIPTFLTIIYCSACSPQAGTQLKRAIITQNNQKHMSQIHATISISTNGFVVSLKNTGASDRYFGLGAFSTRLQFVVTDSQGNAVPVSEFASELKDIDYNSLPTSRPFILRALGGEANHAFPISKIFTPHSGVRYSIKINWKVLVFDSESEMIRWGFDSTDIGTDLSLESNTVTYSN